MTSANVSKVTAGMTVQTSASKKSGKDEQEAVDFMSMLGNFAVNHSQQHIEQNGGIRETFHKG